MELFFITFAPLIFLCSLLTSIRLAFEGIINFPDNKIFRFVTSGYWCIFIFILVISRMGEFARCESSPFPWIAFVESSARHGVYDGFFSATAVLITDLWLFWIPAHYWINNNAGIGKIKSRMARIINLLAGLILTTSSNPIYKLLD